MTLRSMLLLLAAYLLLVLEQPARGEPPAEEKKSARMDRYGDPLPEGAIARLGTVRLRHAGEIQDFTFSPDGKLLASVAKEGDFVLGWTQTTIPLWDTATGKLVRRLPGHKGLIDTIAFSPDGRLLASVGAPVLQGHWVLENVDHHLRLWDVATGKEVFALKEKGAVAFSPDSKLLAVIDLKTNEVQLWDTTTRKKLHDLGGHSDYILARVFSPDGKRLATLDDEQTIRLWDVATGKPLHKWSTGQRFCADRGFSPPLAFSPSGRTLLFWNDKTVLVWDGETGKQVLQADAKKEVSYGSAFFAPDGRVLAVTWGPPTPEAMDKRLIDLQSGRVLLRTDSSCRMMKLAPDGKTVLGAWLSKTREPEENLSRIWDLATGRELRTIPVAASRALFAPDGKALATHSGNDHAIRLWDTATGKERPGFEGHREGVHSVAVSPDRKRVVTATSSWFNEGVFLWDATTSKVLWEESRISGLVKAVSFPGDGKTLAVVDAGEVVFWDVAAGQPKLKDRHGKGRRDHHQTLSLDGKYAASTLDESALVWHVATGKDHRQFDFGRKIRALAFSPEGKYLAVAGDSAHVLVWDVATGKLAHALAYDKGSYEVQAVAFSADGAKLAAANGSVICTWDVATGRLLRKLHRDYSYAKALAFSPDGKLLASGHEDKVVRLWDVAAQREVHRFTGHAGEVLSLAFFPDGKALVSGSADTTALIWQVPDKVREEK
jgi:WD40 repeat protein